MRASKSKSYQQEGRKRMYAALNGRCRQKDNTPAALPAVAQAFPFPELQF